MRESPNIPPDFCTKYPTRRCPYGLTYGGGGTSEGVLATETVALTSRTGNAVTLKDIIFGCGHSTKQPSSTRVEMGVIGFGRRPMSFVSQIAPYVGGNKFSHCLVPLATDPKIESKINFGNGSEVSGEGVVSTPLVPDEGHYIVMAEGMTIGNEFVPFYSNVTSLNKIKMVLDSGSTLTTLPQHLFDRVITELNKTLDPKMQSFFVTKQQTLLCFNSTEIPEEPKMSFHFEGGGKVQLLTEQMFVKNDEKNISCFGIKRPGDKGAVEPDMGVFGAIMQGNMLVGFDLDREVVSFKPTDCLTY
ncbi:PREDICTED: aspartic proteinase CDR1-like [Fragaria vesca subsp. vesca]|uniref:aspartic proteinase CDR1-like n=1 Tax=Fragaria vesca subsp. vesca TaxID=101020 RepID=UPI0002C3143B|nr:PREDICTED: aspartic proteinase CDR1-like [Fragaria vesca subsp. vesca]